MIINVSRASQFQECRRKVMYYAKDRIVPFRVADPLILGGSYHKGLAEFFATGDMANAVFKAEADYRARYEEQTEFILPEEKPFIERQVTWLTNSLAEFAKHYKQQDFEVLQPEVEFTVALPGTKHFCKFMVCAEYPHMKNAAPQEWVEFERTTPRPERWRHPHYFRGKTDAVVAWQGRIWLFEHKTEARTGDSYFTRFLLDFQPTGYIYGVQQSTGIRPVGFVLNIIKKPNAAFKGDPLQVIGFEREAYVRTDEDLLRFRDELSSLADDFEEAYFNPRKVYMNTKACTNWGRACDYHNVCLTHGEVDHNRLLVRPQWDYVELEYYKILGLPEPPRPDPELYTIKPAQETNQ